MRHAYAVLPLAFAATVVIAMAPPLFAQTPKPGDDAEREALRKALATACQEFSRDDQWQQADACRRAFFTAHEEAIWRLDINPHRKVPRGPSS